MIELTGAVTKISVVRRLEAKMTAKYMIPGNRKSVLFYYPRTLGTSNSPSRRKMRTRTDAVLSTMFRHRYTVL